MPTRSGERTVDQVPFLGKARTQPQPARGRLLRNRPLPVSAAQPGRSPGSPGARAALAVVEPVSAPTDCSSVGVSSSTTGHPGDAPPVPTRVPPDGQQADQGSLPLRLAA